MIGPKVIEALAKKVHFQWAKWLSYMLDCSELCPDGSILIPPEHATRWIRQSSCGWDNLSDRERQTDRCIAEAYLATIQGAQEE